MDELPAGQIVTATALIRHFAAHSRQALSEPVHIMNHGHVSLSLISTELFRRLWREPQFAERLDAMSTKLDLVLDMIPTLVILADQDLNLTRINLAARKRIGVTEQEALGQPLSRLITGPETHFVLRALERVRDTAIPEVLEVGPVGKRSLVYRVELASFSGGVAFVADEMTDRIALREQDARRLACESMIDGMPGFARGAFNIRGIVTEMSPGLARLLDADESRIIGLRFATLFEVSDRGAIGDAVEDLLTSGKPFNMTAGLVGGEGKGTSALISAAPLLAADRQAGGLFMIGTVPPINR